jgi:hypothetical protein
MTKGFFFVLMLLPASFWAQLSELAGSIRDHRGACVSNATIELRNQESGIRVKMKARKDGSFTFCRLKSGNYQATVQAAGYKTLTRDNICLEAGKQIRLNLTLQPTIQQPTEFGAVSISMPSMSDDFLHLGAFAV